MQIRSWVMSAVREPLTLKDRDVTPGAGEVVVEVAGCGICHTDLGYLDDGVPTRGALPLTLGHEVSGTIVAAGAGAEHRVGEQVVVPAVLPCGKCERCRAGRGSICAAQVFPGNDIHGGFGSHLVVPAEGLCPVPSLDAADVSLEELSVLADAVTTPYQSIRRSGLAAGDFALFVGIGGVGAFGVQIARALGATVAAIDVDDERLDRITEFGAALTLNAATTDPKDLKKQVRGFAKEQGLPSWGWKVFETSGTPAGQETAFQLLNHGAYLGVVGFTPKAATVRLSNLMAFDARAEGNWGCIPALYPEALALVLEGKVAVRPFVETYPMARVNEVLDGVRKHEIKKRAVLLPDFA